MYHFGFVAGPPRWLTVLEFGVDFVPLGENVEAKRFGFPSNSKISTNGLEYMAHDSYLQG